MIGSVQSIALHKCCFCNYLGLKKKAKKSHSNLLATQISSALKWRFWPLLQPLGNVGQSPYTGMLLFQSGKLVQEGGLLLENEVTQDNEQEKVSVCDLWCVCVGGGGEV